MKEDFEVPLYKPFLLFNKLVYINKVKYVKQTCFICKNDSGFKLNFVTYGRETYFKGLCSQNCLNFHIMSNM